MKPHQRAGAAAAYAAAQHTAPRKPHGAAQQPADQAAEYEQAAPTPAAAGRVDSGTKRADSGGPAGADADAETQLEQDLDELSVRAEKADEYLALAQRTQADFENYRKRAARDAALAQERGVAKLAKELLPALDNLDRALAAAESYVAGPLGMDTANDDAAAGHVQLLDGLKLVHADLMAALSRLGIEPFSPVGERFDPTVHEAVAQQPVEGARSGTVAEVFQQGFRHGETVLRPARVLVAA